jgi:ABC-type nitrate/sulfonate/bicarbonate transport system permease component
MKARFMALGEALVSFAAFFAIWECICRFVLSDTTLLPPPTAIAPLLWKTLWGGDGVRPLANTLLLLFSGYGIGCLAGIAVGLLMGVSRTVYDLLEPLVELARPIPKVALVPPLFLFLGLGATMRITTVALAVFFPVLVGTLQGVRGVDHIAIDTGRTFGVKPWAITWQITLPSALPMILTGMRVSLGIGLIVVVLAEMLSGEEGLGAVLIDTQRSFAIAQMYVWIVILAVLGFVLNTLFERIEDWVVPWRAR